MGEGDRIDEFLAGLDIEMEQWQRDVLLRSLASSDPIVLAPSRRHEMAVWRREQEACDQAICKAITESIEVQWLVVGLSSLWWGVDVAVELDRAYRTWPVSLQIRSDVRFPPNTLLGDAQANSMR